MPARGVPDRIAPTVDAGPAAGRHALRAILAACVLATAPFTVRGADDPASVSSPVACGSRNSARATIAELAADAGRYEGRCVVVDGVLNRQFLYDSVDSIYRGPPDPAIPRSGRVRVGIDRHSSPIDESYRHVTVVGRVYDCGSVRDCMAGLARDGEIIMVRGYCHYFDGSYVDEQSLRVRAGPPLERRMGGAGREGFGDLTPAPADWPQHAMVEALAAGFLRALRADDAERLAGMHFRDVGLEWQDEEAAMLEFLLQRRDSPFAAVRLGSAPPEQMILVERARLAARRVPSPSADDLADYSATVCFCRLPSCAGRWPIATFDADNLPSRPYACTDVGPYLDDGRWVAHFTTRIGAVGLAEPRPRR